jgi:hypothetical protein
VGDTVGETVVGDTVVTVGETVVTVGDTVVTVQAVPSAVPKVPSSLSESPEYDVPTVPTLTRSPHSPGLLNTLLRNTKPPQHHVCCMGTAGRARL